MNDFVVVATMGRSAGGERVARLRRVAASAETSSGFARLQSALSEARRRRPRRVPAIRTAATIIESKSVMPRERACDGIPDGPRKCLPSYQHSRRRFGRFRARRTQGICLKPLRQLRKTAFKSPDRGAVRKSSLPAGIQARLRDLRWFHALESGAVQIDKGGATSEGQWLLGRPLPTRRTGIGLFRQAWAYPRQGSRHRPRLLSGSRSMASAFMTRLCMM
jgi:hypothetical protein